MSTREPDYQTPDTVECRGWATSSIFVRRVNASSASSMGSALPRAASVMAAARRNVRFKPRVRRKPVGNSNNTGSKRETIDEIAGCQTLHRHRRSQDQREPGGRFLEGAEGDRGGTRYDPLRARRCNRLGAPPRQSVVGDPPVCPRSLSQPDWRRARRAQQHARPDGGSAGLLRLTPPETYR